MNDRIDELIEQASVRGEVYLPGDDGHPSPTFYFDKRKFAELIVKECAAVQHKRFCEHGDVSWDILMEHFGVE